MSKYIILLLLLLVYLTEIYCGDPPKPKSPEENETDKPLEVAIPDGADSTPGKGTAPGEEKKGKKTSRSKSKKNRTDKTDTTPVPEESNDRRAEDNSKNRKKTKHIPDNQSKPKNADGTIKDGQKEIPKKTSPGAKNSGKSKKQRPKASDDIQPATPTDDKNNPEKPSPTKNKNSENTTPTNPDTKKKSDSGKSRRRSLLDEGSNGENQTKDPKMNNDPQAPPKVEKDLQKPTTTQPESSTDNKKSPLENKIPPSIPQSPSKRMVPQNVPPAIQIPSYNAPFSLKYEVAVDLLRRINNTSRFFLLGATVILQSSPNTRDVFKNLIFVISYDAMQFPKEEFPNFHTLRDAINVMEMFNKLTYASLPFIIKDLEKALSTRILFDAQIIPLLKKRLKYALEQTRIGMIQNR